MHRLSNPARFIPGRKWLTCSVGALAIGAGAAALTSRAADRPAAPAAAADFSQVCQAATIQVLAASLPGGVTVKEIPNGPKLPGGTVFVPSSGRLPAYCQITGSYVTNPRTGKTANFMATLPANWNGKYLQLGCSGSCGVLLMNNAMSPPITITAQGYPGQIVEKGYASFGNDLGHLATGGSLSMAWAADGPGRLKDDAVTDFLYRADQVMAGMGKAFTIAFYGRLSGSQPRIAKSYFNGCSQGGREALVAANRFPQEFDGIIAGSPAIDFGGTALQAAGAAVATLRSADADVSPQLMALVGKTVTAQCDGKDGVVDGVIQNPAACDFRPERDLPRCDAGSAGQCFTPAQAQTVSALLSAATDEQGRVVQPGYAVSEPSTNFRPMSRPANLDAAEPWPSEASTSGYWGLGQGVIGTLVRRNDPNFRLRSIYSYSSQAGYFHTQVPAREARLARTALASGTPTAEGMTGLMRSRTKLLMYHTLSDEILTPYMSINLYKRLAARHGGYAKVQRSVRLFSLPGATHCGMAGVGPTNFDAIGALEAWVEKGIGPNALLARQLDPKVNNLIMGKVDWSKPALRTMPLCMFPQMARYKGTGDVKDAANWSCPSGDTSMLRVGESGRAAGVID